MVDRVSIVKTVKNNLDKLFILLLLASCQGKFDYVTIDQNNQKSQETEYVSGSSDIPLFSGLEQLEGENTNFDTISGNIITSSYVGDVELSEVKYFYLETLPQFGWELVSEKEGSFSYKRKDDILEISLKQNDDNKLIVKFFISSSTQ